MPIYKDFGTMRVRGNDAEAWERLARKLERELRLLSYDYFGDW
jgi:hypothetical protein